MHTSKPTPWSEHCYIIAGPEFGEFEAHIFVIHKALYGWLEDIRVLLAQEICQLPPIDALSSLQGRA